MTKYIQTNQNGYVTSITEEPLLIGLFGGKSTRYSEITDEQARVVEALLKEEHSKGEGLHISRLECLITDTPKKRR
ncbi:MAG: hypothetical protein WC867_02830 [Candidatus Pacearchaeota archaeon]|jgi:hypothetical protein